MMLAHLRTPLFDMGVTIVATFCWISSTDTEEWPLNPILNLRNSQKLYSKTGRTQWLRIAGIWLFIKNWHGIVSWCKIQLFLHSQPCPPNSIPQMCQKFISYLSNHHQLIYVKNGATFPLLLNTNGLLLCFLFSSNSRLLKSAVPVVHSRFLKTPSPFTTQLISLVCKRLRCSPTGETERLWWALATLFHFTDDCSIIIPINSTESTVYPCNLHLFLIQSMLILIWLNFRNFWSSHILPQVQDVKRQELNQTTL